MFHTRRHRGCETFRSNQGELTKMRPDAMRTLRIGLAIPYSTTKESSATVRAADAPAGQSRTPTMRSCGPRRIRSRVAGAPLRKCHDFETDLGAIVVRQPSNAQVSEDQHVTRSEILHARPSLPNPSTGPRRTEEAGPFGRDNCRRLMPRTVQPRAAARRSR